MRGTDRSMERFARIEIMIDPVNARRLESLGLGLVHQAQRAANLYGQFLLDRANRSGDVIDLAVQRTSSADHDTVSLRLGAGGLASALDHLPLRQEIVSFDGRGRNGGL